MFESIMWQYTKEEKKLLSALIENPQVKNAVGQLKDMNALYLVGHGSSYNALTAASAILSKYVRTYGYTPSNFSYNANSLDLEDQKHTWVLGISQTGTSRGVLEALQKAKEKGYKIITITNVKDSPMDKLADLTLFLECGEEESNAKTKGYSSTLVVLLMLAYELGLLKGQLSSAEYESLYAELKTQINDIDEVITQTTEWCQKNQYGQGLKDLYVVGNGINFATAMEGQLKVMETHCIPTMFNDIQEFSHGMHRSLNEHSNVLLLNSCVDVDLVEKTFSYLQSKKIPVIMLDTEGNLKDDRILKFNKYPATMSILLITTAIQVISAFVPELHGQDPNRDANNDYTDYVATRV